MEVPPAAQLAARLRAQPRTARLADAFAAVAGAHLVEALRAGADAALAASIFHYRQFTVAEAHAAIAAAGIPVRRVAD